MEFESKSAMSIADIAKILQVSKTHVLKLLHGKVANCPPIPHVSLGRKIVVKRASFERWMESMERV